MPGLAQAKRNNEQFSNAYSIPANGFWSKNSDDVGYNQLQKVLEFLFCVFCFKGSDWVCIYWLKSELEISVFKWILLELKWVDWFLIGSWGETYLLSGFVLMELWVFYLLDPIRVQFSVLLCSMWYSNDNRGLKTCESLCNYFVYNNIG